MDTAKLETTILAKLAEQNEKGYRALDLMKELDSSYSESQVQRSLAMLLSEKRVYLTPTRHLEVDELR